MKEKKSLSDQRIIECLNIDYGIKVATVTVIPLGADIDATVYKAHASDQATYFVKVKYGHHHDIGPIIQLMLHDTGIQQIIAPIKTNLGQPTCHIADCTLIVYPFIEGQNGFITELSDNQWVTLGKAVRHVHKFQLPPLIKHQIKKETYSPKWRDAVRTIYAHIDAGQKTIDDEIALKLLTFMKKRKKTIQHLIERAEQLAEKIKQQSHDFVLCHADLHAGNMLIANNGTLYIVDWDQPIMAPKERDLMFIGAGVGNVWNNPHEEKLFYNGYGKTDINKEVLAYYRYERIVEDIAEYCQQLLLTTGGGKNREVMDTQFMDMFEPRSVVDIAFKTDTGR